MLKSLLSKRLKEMGTSQNQMARDLGMPESALSNAATGKRTVEAGEIVRFAEYLSLPAPLVLSAITERPVEAVFHREWMRQAIVHAIEGHEKSGKKATPEEIAEWAIVYYLGHKPDEQTDSSPGQSRFLVKA